MPFGSPRPMHRAALAVVCALWVGFVLPGCDRHSTQNDDRVRSVGQLDELQPGDELQVAELREDDGVIDGDTFRVVGFGDTLRPLCIDAEELFEDDRHRREAHRNWQGYRQRKTVDADQPVDYGTPMGDRATDWAEEFFDEHGPTVWLEYASPKRTRGFFGRHLVYVWAREGGEGDWLNYNIEAVRAGMTPYFTRFGRCEEYHDHFEAAQQQARENERGIWDPGAPAYDDYDERIERWERRADQIELFRRRFGATRGIIELGTDTAMSRLRTKVGQSVIVFGSVANHLAGADPPRLELHHRHRQPLRVEADEGIDFERFDIDLDDADYVYVLGDVEMYRGDPVVQVDTGSFILSGDDPPPLEDLD